MSLTATFPPLDGWEPTKRTLHLCAKAIGAVSRAHGEFHPKWWHISLKVQPDGLVTNDMLLPNGGTFKLRMDLREHAVILSTSRGLVRSFSLKEISTSTEFGDSLLKAVSGLGLEGEYGREKYRDDEVRQYDPDMAERFFGVLLTVSSVFEQHRASLEGEKGPVQLWPHGFDMSFEWFGTRVETFEENGKIKELPSQLSLGFAPGDGVTGPYFYSNPWPFEADRLVNQPLPLGARWYNESWQGTILPYSELVDDPFATDRLLAYAKAVYAICSPTLLA